MNQNKGFNGNPNLKPLNYIIQYEDWQIQELRRCAKDPIYFIENYCKIVSLDHGIIPFKLYEYQKEAVEVILGNRKVILMTARQMGKCQSENTLINIRNKETKEVSKITIGEFYEWHRFRQWFKDNFNK